MGVALEGLDRSPLHAQVQLAARNGDAAGSDERGEGRGLDAEEPEDGDDQRDVQEDLQCRLDVARERDVELLLCGSAAARVEVI